MKGINVLIVNDLIVYDYKVTSNIKKKVCLIYNNARLKGYN